MEMPTLLLQGEIVKISKEGSVTSRVGAIPFISPKTIQLTNKLLNEMIIPLLEYELTVMHEKTHLPVFEIFMDTDGVHFVSLYTGFFAKIDEIDILIKRIIDNVVGDLENVLLHQPKHVDKNDIEDAEIECIDIDNIKRSYLH